MISKGMLFNKREVSSIVWFIFHCNQLCMWIYRRVKRLFLLVISVDHFRKNFQISLSIVSLIKWAPIMPSSSTTLLNCFAALLKPTKCFFVETYNTPYGGFKHWQYKYSIKVWEKMDMVHSKPQTRSSND